MSAPSKALGSNLIALVKRYHEQLGYVQQDDVLFICECLSVIPFRLHGDLLARHQADYSNARCDANLVLLNAAEKQKQIVKVQKKYLQFSPAKKHAYTCDDLIRKEGIESGAYYCESMGINAPSYPIVEGNPHQPDSQASAILKMTSEDRWKKSLAIRNKRNNEASEIRAGKVYKRGEVYTSNRNVKAYADDKQAERAWVDAGVLISEDNEEIAFKTVSDASVANPYNRFAEYMIRVKGMESIADKTPVDYRLVKALPKRMTYGSGGLISDIPLLDAVAKEGDNIVKVAFALTVPSRFHPYKFIKKHNKFIRNPKYQNLTPKQAQAWLQETWGMVTREWERKNSPVDAYGFKVLEVHHAGTVHNHLAIYVKAKHVQRMIKQFYQAALRGDEGQEAGAIKRRLNWKVMTTSGGMVNYMTKYISKGLTGASFEDIQSGLSSDDALIRIMAHRSLWALRQFAFYRSPSVTVWRELRRLQDQPIKNETLEKARLAAIGNDWAAYVEVQGGVFAKASDRPIATVKAYRTNDAGSRLLNQYGEYIEYIRGVEVAGFQVITRRKQWTLLNITMLKKLLEGRYKALSGGAELNDSKGLDAVIEKARQSQQTYKLAKFAGIKRFSPLDSFEITPQVLKPDRPTPSAEYYPRH